MRAIVVGVALTTAAVVAVDVLGDLTQTRPDARDRDGATEIEVSVTAKPGAGRLDFAVDGLWGACQGTVQRRLQGAGWQEAGPGRFRGTLYPALGEHARQRLRGCLHDVTVDRVKAKVVAMDRVPVCPSVAAGASSASSATRAPRCAEVRRAVG